MHSDHPIRRCFVASFLILVASQTAFADQSLLKAHCVKCHSGDKPKAGFDIKSLGGETNKGNHELWTSSIDYVKSGEMPPAKNSRLSESERQRLIRFFEANIRQYERKASARKQRTPRRLNNRELINSVADVLLLKDVGTHQPMANLLGDSLQDGFDTSGATLGLSEYHLEQYINSVRMVVDATILSGPKPVSRRYKISSDGIFMPRRDQNTQQRDLTRRNADSIDFLDTRRRAYFGKFKNVPETGIYRINMRAMAVDRGVYDSDKTGIHDLDPIQLRIYLGDRIRNVDLPDDKPITIKLVEWLARGTRLEMTNPTDGLRLRGNGNFKFQYAIAGEYILETQPERYKKIAAAIKPTNRRVQQPSSWQHWRGYWQGPRPRLYNAEIEGPLFESWPPERQVALLGESPTLKNVAAILQPIAQRAWRRNVDESELAPIVRLVNSRAELLRESVGDKQSDDFGKSVEIEALKEGLVAILVSPSFLLINPNDAEPADVFATKLSFFLGSTIPDAKLRNAARRGELDSFDSVRAEIKRRFKTDDCKEFLGKFPYSWLQLDRINFMAPDPDRFRLYDRKRISEDMVAEVLHFFRYAIENNRPVTEMLTANYSFLNADLAKVYGVDNVAQDSTLRKYTFADGRRGGILGMGAFLTLTADSLGTSPIHRAIYVMENLLGIHPTPPPADVKIEEPDVRQAKTIKEILAAHTADKTCAACHERIDPYGYAFENFGPMGEWRDTYPAATSIGKSGKAAAHNRKQTGIPVDASSKFLTGASYKDIVEFRKLMQTNANRDRFVRCFITKLLTYANGEQPDNYTEVEKIVAKSAEHDYQIIETIAAIVDSPLFRDQ